MKICPRCSELYPDDAARCPKDGSNLRAVLDPLIGKTVGGRYRLISRLGSGGMSSVYLARHVMIDRLMAIKTLRRDLARDPVQRDRFIREARAVNRINHENIVEITDFGESEDGLVYLVMEYVPGDSLLKVMSAGPMAAARGIHIVHQCGLALARAHQMGVIHRDLKPENILLVERPRRPDFVKILDFGIAKILDAPSLTGSQQIFGTPGYIAPEYIQSTQIDGRADLYSLGVILYELITGALPFDYEYPGDLLVKHVTEEPIPPRERLPTIDKPVEELILRCLRKDPAERFRDAYHFLEELQKVRELLGSPRLWGALGEDGPGDENASHGSFRPRAGGVTTKDEALADTDEGDDLRDTADDGAPPSFLGTTLPDMGAAAAEAQLRDTLDDSRGMRAGRPVTQDYLRPKIPETPSVEAVAIPIDVEIELGQDEPAGVKPPSKTPPPTPFDPVRDGLLAVKRWRRRFDAIRGFLDEIEVERQRPAPPEITRAMAFASRTLEEFEGSTSQTHVRQARLEELGEQARDFRSTLGKAIDNLAGKLSQRRGELEELASRRDELRDRREAARQRVRTGDAAEGEADALLWELAAIEQEVRAAGTRCDDLEVQVTDLQSQLDGKNEEMESERARAVQELDGEMARLEAMGRALREPLEQAEQFILSYWDEHGVERARRVQTPSDLTERS
jgi:serine/threonine-protein kinase